MSRYRRAESSIDGSYEFSGVARGPYQVRFLDRVLVSHLDVDEDTRLNLQVDGFLELGGRVVRATGGDVQLELLRGYRRAREAGYFSLSPWQLELGATDEFSFGGLEPGEYRIRVRGDGCATQDFDFELRESRRDVELELQRGLTLTGGIEIAIDRSHGPVSVQLWHDEAGDGPAAFSGGSFRYEGLLPGDWSVLIDSGGDGGERRIERTLRLVLEEDIDDFFYRLDEYVPARFQVRLPAGASATEGDLRATRGAARVTNRVRLAWKGGAVHHQRSVDGGYGQSWREDESLRLDLDSGEWTVELDLLGYEPWQRVFDPAELEPGQVHLVDLQPASGRVVTTDYDSRYFRIEARRKGAQDWQLILWRDSRVTSSHVAVPGVAQAFLSAGEYDVRIRCRDRAGETRRSLRIEPGPEVLALEFELDEGLAIQGTIESTIRTPWIGALYLNRLADTGNWEPIEPKEHLGDPQGKFSFRGLHPGEYRASLDRQGETVVAEWHLSDRDVVEQRVIATPLTAPAHGKVPR